LKQVQAYFVAVGQLEKTLEPEEYYTNDFIKQINDFDYEAIIKKTKEFKLP
jgi:hypothetical protein